MEYLKYRAFYWQSFYRTLIGNHTQSIEWHQFQWPWMTSNPDFKVVTFFEVEYRKKTKLLFAQEETLPGIWNGTMFGDLDWPLNASREFVSISWACCFVERQKAIIHWLKRDVSCWLQEQTQWQMTSKWRMFVTDHFASNFVRCTSCRWAVIACYCFPISDACSNVIAAVDFTSYNKLEASFWWGVSVRVRVRLR